MADTASASSSLPGRSRWLPWCVLGLCLALTAALCSWSHKTHRAEQRALLERRVETFGRALAAQVQSYVDTLPGLRVFGVLMKSPSDAEFLQYVEAISLQKRFPGLALTFAADLVDDDRRAAYVQAVRGDRSVDPQGHPGFDIKPPGARPLSMVLRHAYPFDETTFGYDLYDPQQRYREPVEAAIASGGYVATGPILLARDRFKSADPALTSVVIRAATYAGGLIPATEAARRQAAQGVVGISFKMLAIVQSVLPPDLAKGADVRIVDPSAQAAGANALLFDSRWLAPAAPAGASVGEPIRHAASVADRVWEITVTERAIGPALDGVTVLLIVLGTALSMSLATMTRALVDANASAERRVLDGLAALHVEQDNLARSEGRYRMLFANSLDAVLHTRPTGEILAANDAACRLFGCSEAQLRALGRTPLVDTSDPRLGALIEQRQRTGRSQGLCRMLRADGTSFEAELASSVYVDVDGQTASSVIVRDVTERQTLAAQRQRLTDILDMTPDFVGSANPQGRNIYLNLAARRMLGRGEREDVSSLTIEDCHPPWALRVIREEGIPAALREGTWTGRTAIRGADGREIPVSQAILCHRDAHGALTHLSTIARDLSELEEAQAQRRALETRMLEAQKMESIGTLAGGVAHDFNNVLVAILGNAVIARQQLPLEHPVQPALGLIQQAATRARTLVQQILTYSRRSPQERSVLSLRVAVEESLSLLRTTLPATAQLVAELAQAPLVVMADASQVQQVVLNLCTNAWQAIGDRPGRIDVFLDAVELTASAPRPKGLAPGRYARLRVVDDGDGMDAATRDRVFEPFFTTKPVGQGTGLGLAVVHGIVASSGGAIEVESRPGAGTTFCVHLPLVDAQALPAGEPPAAPVHAPTPQPLAGGPRHVLYVDDDEVVTITVTALLENAGHRVTSLGRAQDAIEAVRSGAQRFDLVLTDHNMPGMSGLALAAVLREIAPEVPVVIASGYVTEKLQLQARLAGARGVLPKEFGVERLVATVDAVLDGAAVQPFVAG